MIARPGRRLSARSNQRPEVGGRGWFFCPGKLDNRDTQVDLQQASEPKQDELPMVRDVNFVCQHGAKPSANCSHCINTPKTHRD
jgi:hypothetical protein